MSPTGAELCATARARLQAAGVEGADRDVQRLFLHALNVGLRRHVARHHLAGFLGHAVPLVVEQAFEAAIDARSRRQPVSQITGRRMFWNHEFIVTPDTLDPRPETETLLAAALDLPWSSVLDLGTGTGAILISLLAARPGGSGLGCDISPPALEVARRNADLIGVKAAFAPSDWFDGITGRFDLIVSNPPYIPAADIPDLLPEVREWEPLLALTDGGDGLGAYRRIAADAGRFLTPGGHVLVEFGQDQGADVAAIFEGAGAEIRLIPDLDRRDRVLSARFPA